MGAPPLLRTVPGPSGHRHALRKGSDEGLRHFYILAGLFAASPLQWEGHMSC